MKKKVINVIVYIVIYYLSVLLVTFIFKKIGWIKGNIYMYSLAITIGWTIAKLLIESFKKQ